MPVGTMLCNSVQCDIVWAQDTAVRQQAHLPLGPAQLCSGLVCQAAQLLWPLRQKPAGTDARSYATPLGKCKNKGATCLTQGATLGCWLKGNLPTKTPQPSLTTSAVQPHRMMSDCEAMASTSPVLLKTASRCTILLTLLPWPLHNRSQAIASQANQNLCALDRQHAMMRWCSTDRCSRRWGGSTARCQGRSQGLGRCMRRCMVTTAATACREEPFSWSVVVKRTCGHSGGTGSHRR